MIPTIGIGASPLCDGQVLVSYDVIGLFDEFAPPFVKQYAQLGEVIVSAAKTYSDEVQRGVFLESSAAPREPARISMAK
jgi:3-methyl-2-oxobutanoate hydroxymethyltransferase